MKIPLVGGREIEPSELGFTLIHEHLKVESEAVKFQWPHLYNDELALKLAVDEVKKVMRFGVKSICDPTVMGLGRDIRFMERVVKETGIQLLAATGIYIYTDLPFYFVGRSVDEIADLFVHDIKQGIQGTKNRAAFIKFATDEPGVTPDVEKVIRAAAIAHKETGVPIITHSNAHKRTGLDQQRILKEEGVDLGRVLIGHVGDSEDIEYVKKIIENGSYVGLDRYGLDLFLPIEKRNEVVLRLIREGYIDKIFLSQDYCCTIDWGIAKPENKPKLAPKWSMSLLFEEVIPTLKRHGVKDEHIYLIFVENPKRFFSGK
ncbi:MAG: phosphotriesterase [Sulfolobaceae archaeon]